MREPRVGHAANRTTGAQPAAGTSDLGDVDAQPAAGIDIRGSAICCGATTSPGVALSRSAVWAVVRGGVDQVVEEIGDSLDEVGRRGSVAHDPVVIAVIADRTVVVEVVGSGGFGGVSGPGYEVPVLVTLVHEGKV